MSRQARAAWLGAALLAAYAAALPAQVLPAATRTKTPAAEAAQAAFRRALYELQNVGGAARVTRELDAALAADAELGIARVFKAVVEPGLTPAAREARAAESLGVLGSASPAEILLATYWREAAGGRQAAALPLLELAARLAPEDPEIHYLHLTGQGPGTPAEQVAKLHAFLQRFPDHAAAWNQLSYVQWRAGDREAALAAVQKYAELAPEHPNAHDSYADILLLLDRAEEARTHAVRMQQIDPAWPNTLPKLGAIELTLRNVRAARTHFDAAMNAATTPGARMQALYWHAAADLQAGDVRAALQRLGSIADIARAANLPAAVTLAHARAALLEAYAGSARKVPQHLAAAEAAATNDNMKATYRLHAALAFSRLGQPEEARAAVAEYIRVAGTAATAALPIIETTLALDRKDYAAAETAVAGVTGMDGYSRALRAEVLLRTGRKAEGEAQRKAVLPATVKIDGSPGVDFNALFGRIRLQKL